MNTEKKLAKRNGLEKGKKDGKREEKLAVAKKMKEDGLTTEIIIKYTGLTKEEIEKLYHFFYDNLNIPCLIRKKDKIFNCLYANTEVT